MKDGKKYPPTTIRSILSAQNIIFKESKAPFSISKSSHSGVTPYAVTSELHREGIGVSNECYCHPFRALKPFLEATSGVQYT